MPPYQVSVLDEAEHDLAQLDKPTARRIAKRVEWLAQHLDEIKPEPLTGEWSRFCKFRVGDWRVISKIIHAERLIVVHRIRHRREVYREP